jgi:hypothetical protein
MQFGLAQSIPVNWARFLGKMERGRGRLKWKRNRMKRFNINFPCPELILDFKPKMDSQFFQSVNSGFLKMFAKAFKDEVNNHPILSQVKRTRYEHGPSMSVVDVEGSETVSEMQRIGSDFILDHAVIESGDSAKFRQVLTKGISEMRDGILKMMFQKVGEAADRVGNTVDGKGERLSADMVISMFEKIAIKFDKQGRPEMPTITLSPDLEKTFREIMERPEVKLRIDVILRQKWMQRYALDFK